MIYEAMSHHCRVKEPVVSTLPPALLEQIPSSLDDARFVDPGGALLEQLTLQTHRLAVEHVLAHPGPEVDLSRARRLLPSAVAQQHWSDLLRAVDREVARPAGTSREGRAGMVLLVRTAHLPLGLHHPIVRACDEVLCEVLDDLPLPA